VLTLVFLTAVVLAFWVLSLLRALKMVRSGPAVRAQDNVTLPNPPPRVSICVPARNEEKNLPALLQGLRAQRYPDLQIIVVDDNSTDGTWEVLQQHAREDARIIPIKSGEPEAGWYGKPNALRQALTHAQGEWILMTDADCVHDVNCVRNAVAWALAEGVEALSLTPRMRCVSFWEKLLIPSIGGLLMTGYSFKRVNDPQDEKVFGAGAFFLVSRRILDAAGGMEPVRGVADEDVALARALKRTGLGYRFARGDDVYATRMYTGLGEIFTGFARNTFSTMKGSIRRLVRLSMFILLISVIPVALLVASVVDFSSGNVTWMSVFGVTAYLAILGMQAMIRRLGRFDAWVSVFAPLGGVLTWLVVMNSFWLGLRGKGVAWKGRVYPSV